MSPVDYFIIKNTCMKFSVPSCERVYLLSVPDAREAVIDISLGMIYSGSLGSLICSSSHGVLNALGCFQLSEVDNCLQDSRKSQLFLDFFFFLGQLYCHELIYWLT